MPELAEVEVTRRQLLPLLGLTVACAEKLSDKNLLLPLGKGDLGRLSGARLDAIDRRGKYLIWHFLGADGVPLEMVVHLGMSGKTLLDAADASPHDHLRWHWSQGATLTYRDVRRFGFVAVGDVGLGTEMTATMGPEPWDETWAAQVAAKAKKGSRSVKALLMDQSVAAGLGNIYVCEALFATGIHPETPAYKLKNKQIEALHEAVQGVLERAIAAGGSSIQDFKAAHGSPGYFQLELKVYGRAGEGCPACGEEIRAIKQQGRTTFFCARCQR